MESVSLPFGMIFLVIGISTDTYKTVLLIIPRWVEPWRHMIVGSYASVGGAPEAYGSRRVCVSVCVSVCVCVCMSFVRISLQRLKTKR